ncbi:MAG: MBOAT family protein, partial [Lachnospiraceae bacterium]|nr:MBOAT family protein [Lachnospiraceae bacterium]
AIGLGRMFGFVFLENFDHPYTSLSIREFWRRWHISLSSWFREYLYIPLGGNRKGAVRTYVNLIIVFAMTGLWHGASWSFVFWGLYHGFFMILERIGFGKLLDGEGFPRKLLSWVYMFFIVNIGWIFFRAEKLSTALGMVLRLFGAGGSAGVVSIPLGSVLSTQIVLAFFLGLVGMGFLKRLPEKWKNLWFYSVPEALYLMLVLAYSIVLLANQTYNPFIYFRF